MGFIASPHIQVVHKTRSSADSAVFLDFCLQIEKKNFEEIFRDRERVIDHNQGVKKSLLISVCITVTSLESTTRHWGQHRDPKEPQETLWNAA